MLSLIVTGDARRIPLPDRSVHCVVTSPPYWGLRDYGVAGQIGQESSPEEYVAVLVAVFREVRRVLRDDGMCWLNIGDSRATGASSYRKAGGKCFGKQYRVIDSGSYPVQQMNRMPVPGISKGNLVGIPWRLAFALQADGWILRSEVIWHKPGAMPESCKTRPAQSHEQLFMLTKRPRYYYDWFGVLERAKAGSNGSRFDRGKSAIKGMQQGDRDSLHRNLRTVWTISSEGYRGAHFATFPSKLVAQCVKAGTSKRGVCPKCGSQWIREVVREPVVTRPGVNTKIPSGWNTSPGRHDTIDGRYAVGNRDPLRHVTRYAPKGWKPGCDCGLTETLPAVVFDPFGGAGTVPLVAEGLGRRGFMTELSAAYCRMALERIRRPHRSVARPRQEPEESMPLFERRLPKCDT